MANCPLGFICEGVIQRSCDLLRAQARDEFAFGDIFGGIYCPEGSSVLENCPVGSFCVNPVSQYRTEGDLSFVHIHVCAFV
jgi:hypothetical protein